LHGTILKWLRKMDKAPEVPNASKIPSVDVSVPSTGTSGNFSRCSRLVSFRHVAFRGCISTLPSPPVSIRPSVITQRHHICQMVISTSPLFSILHHQLYQYLYYLHRPLHFCARQSLVTVSCFPFTLSRTSAPRFLFYQPLSRLCRASACTIIISSLLKDLGVGRAQTYYDGRPHYYFLRGMSIMSRPLSKSIHTVERVTCNLYTLTSVYSTLPAYNYGVT
jgi:hypothetical protein